MKKLPADRHKLVTDHMGLARGLAYRHSKWPSPDRPSREELESAALEALVDAAIRWVPAKGPFSAFAVLHIKWALQLTDQRATYPVSVPDKVHRLIRDVRRAIAAGHTTPASVAAVTGISLHKVKELWPYRVTGGAPLDYASDAAVDARMDDDLERDEEHAAVRAAVAALPDEARAVVEARFGFTTGRPMTTAEIAAHLDAPTERVRAIEEDVLPRLRDELGRVGRAD